MKTRFVVSLASALALMMFAPGGARAIGAGKSCGGIVAQQCKAGSFCQYQPGQCARSDAAGTCTKIPKSCPRTTGPDLQVCGCDHQTYIDDCERQKAAVSLADKGACK